MTSLLASLLLLAAPAIAADASPVYRVDHIACESAPGRFERRKVFPSVKDETRLRFIAASGETGILEYSAVHIGLMGGDDCRVEFRANYETTGTRLYLFPQRQTLRRGGGFFLPCETLTADVQREFALRLTPSGLVLEGEDVTGRCGGPRRGRLQLILERM